MRRMLPKLKALGHRVLIFSQMVQLMDLLQVRSSLSALHRLYQVRLSATVVHEFVTTRT